MAVLPQFLLYHSHIQHSVLGLMKRACTIEKQQQSSASLLPTRGLQPLFLQHALVRRTVEQEIRIDTEGFEQPRSVEQDNLGLRIWSLIRIAAPAARTCRTFRVSGALSR